MKTIGRNSRTGRHNDPPAESARRLVRHPEEGVDATQEEQTDLVSARNGNGTHMPEGITEKETNSGTKRSRERRGTSSNVIEMTKTATATSKDSSTATTAETVDPPVDEPSKKFWKYQLQIPDELFKDLEQVAKRRHTTVSGLLRGYIKLGLLAETLDDSLDEGMYIHKGGTETKIMLL